MYRRTFLGIIVAALLAPANLWPSTGRAANLSPADGHSPGGTIAYTPENHTIVKRSKKPYILDFFATWCGTCRAQERAIERLRANNADYNSITVLKVNWDAYRTEPVARDLNIPRRSTLVLLTGDEEIDRIVASTRMRDIKNLLDLGLRHTP